MQTLQGRPSPCFGACSARAEGMVWGLLPLHCAEGGIVAGIGPGDGAGLWQSPQLASTLVAEWASWTELPGATYVEEEGSVGGAKWSANHARSGLECTSLRPSQTFFCDNDRHPYTFALGMYALQRHWWSMMRVHTRCECWRAKCSLCTLEYNGLERYRMVTIFYLGSIWTEKFDFGVYSNRAKRSLRPSWIKWFIIRNL